MIGFIGKECVGSHVFALADDKERKLNNMNEIACPLAHLLCCIKGPIGLLLDL